MFPCVFSCVFPCVSRVRACVSVCFCKKPNVFRVFPCVFRVPTRECTAEAGEARRGSFRQTARQRCGPSRGAGSSFSESSWAHHSRGGMTSTGVPPSGVKKIFGGMVRRARDWVIGDCVCRTIRKGGDGQTILRFTRRRGGAERNGRRGLQKGTKGTKAKGVDGLDQTRRGGDAGTRRRKDSLDGALAISPFRTPDARKNHTKEFLKRTCLRSDPASVAPELPHLLDCKPSARRAKSKRTFHLPRHESLLAEIVSGGPSR